MALSPALDASSSAAGRGDLFVRLRSWGDTVGIESVVVVRAGPIYFVFDPLEPLRAGEFEIWMVLDRNFHELAGIAD